MTLETDTVIVGAGPAGLAVGASLRRAGSKFIILERGQRVGESWRGHYKRLHLHTPKRHSALPYRPFPTDYPTYPSKDQMVAYLEDYARAFDLQPEFGREVRTCTRNGDDRWVVSTDAGEYRAHNVVMASGLSRIPNRPRWPGEGMFRGTIVHSSDYTDGKQFVGKRVLVVGFGNTGAEIALDLLEYGAECTVSVRGKVNVIPRDLLGIPIIVFALLWRPLPPRVADAMNRLTLRLAVGNLAKIGLEKRDDGPIAEIVETRQIPVIDVGTLARITSGEIKVRKGVQSFDGPDVHFADGKREPFDAVILATGYRSGMASMLPQDSHILDAAGVPRGVAEGLYFCGYDVSKARAGLLRQIGAEARQIAEAISRNQPLGRLQTHEK
jgi:cation diffusion facilitator CzcD-associated flavoprotein CzcO